MFGCVRKSCKAACSCNYLRMLLCTCRFCQGLGSQILSTNKLFPVGRTLPVWLTRLTKIPACLTYSATQKSFPFSTIRRWQTSRYLWPVTFMWNHASWAENLKMIKLSGTQTWAADVWFDSSQLAEFFLNLQLWQLVSLQPFNLQRPSVPLCKDLDPVVNIVSAQETCSILRIGFSFKLILFP